MRLAKRFIWILFLHVCAFYNCHVALLICASVVCTQEPFLQNISSKCHSFLLHKLIITELAFKIQLPIFQPTNYQLSNNETKIGFEIRYFIEFSASGTCCTKWFYKF